MERRTLPIGIQSLGEIRRMDCHYVDKMAHVLRLTREGEIPFPVAPAALREEPSGRHAEGAVRGQRGSVPRVGEGVAARNAVRQAHEPARKPLLGTAEVLHVGAALAAARRRRKTDHRHPVQAAERRAAPTRVRNPFKYTSKLFHVRSPHTLGSTRHESNHNQNTRRWFKCDCPATGPHRISRTFVVPHAGRSSRHVMVAEVMGTAGACRGRRRFHPARRRPITGKD